MLKSTGKSLLFFIIFAFLLFAFNLALTNSGAQTGTFQVSVAGTAVGSIPHQIDLKVTQLPGGQLSEVTGFAVTPEDVVQVKQGENIVISTSVDLQVHQVTVRNIQGIPVDLVALPNNAWSLQGLIPGVYTLDVIADMSSSGILGTFETILVVLAPNQQPFPPTTIISQITIEETEVCPRNTTLVNGTCQSPPPSGGPPPGPGENNTGIICTLEISYGQGPCDEHYIPPDENGQCPEGHRFVDDDTGCVPEGFLNPPTPPITPPIECPEGQTGIPPNCQPINCNVEDPPPECGKQPVVCPDGSTVSSGNDCPEPSPENGGESPEGGDGGGGQPSEGGDGTGGDGGNRGDGSDDGNGGDGGDGEGTIDIPSLFGP